MSGSQPSFPRAFWEEVGRRCDEAEAHPERLLPPEQFFKDVQEMIDREKAERFANGRQDHTKQTTMKSQRHE